MDPIMFPSQSTSQLEARPIETPQRPSMAETSAVPPQGPKSNTILWVALILLVLSILGGVGYFLIAGGKLPFLNQQKTWCTQEAKICPDGTSVGRSEPNCEFAPCPTLTPSPTPDPTANWKLINRKNWQFKVPPNWNYWECNDELIFVGPEINADKIEECAFDSSPGAISVARTQGKNRIIAPINENPKYDPYISNKSTILVGGKEATKQQEKISDGQGQGTRVVIYIKQDDWTDVIGLHDLQEINNLDQILSTFKFIATNNEGILGATVIRSPTCAGPQRPGEICEAPVASETFNITKLSDNEIIQTVRTDKDGKFTISLAPGTYKLQSTTSGIGKNIRNPDFTIAAGKIVTQRFDVDTGIR